MTLGAQAFGLAWQTSAGLVLDTWYPEPQLCDDPSGSTSVSPRQSPPQYLSLAIDDVLRGVNRVVVQTIISDLSQKPQDVYDAYLRLHLLSTRLVQPHSINLDGIFGILPNNVWTNYGPCLIDDFERTRMLLQQRGPVTVYSVDKFPRMVDYVLPSGVRIADADRVRLGAYLAPGTTVMHEGFINFNAGTLGQSMVEGRVSAGVVIGAGSDIGGGASIMGTLSGGGKEVISIGERTLVGANAGVGISLGDNCIVEAGLYLTAGTKVTLPDGAIVKAQQLAHFSDILYVRNSLSGVVQAISRKDQRISLNEQLHAN